MLPDFIHNRRPRRAPDADDIQDVMVDMFVDDITRGIADTGVKAGILKCCTDRPGVTRGIDRVLRAVAWARRHTGVPISTHTDAGQQTGRDQQRVFAEEGVDLSRVVIDHSGDSTDLGYLRVRAQFPDWVFEHLSDDVLPALQARGVEESQIEQMLVANPRRLFEQQGAY